jgi:hypothetical protein
MKAEKAAGIETWTMSAHVWCKNILMGSPTMQCQTIDKVEAMGARLDELEKKSKEPILAPHKEPQSYVQDMSAKLHELIDYMEKWELTGDIHIDMAILGVQAGMYRVMATYNDRMIQVYEDLAQVGGYQLMEVESGVSSEG